MFGVTAKGCRGEWDVIMQIYSAWVAQENHVQHTPSTPHPNPSYVSQSQQNLKISSLEVLPVSLDFSSSCKHDRLKRRQAWHVPTASEPAQGHTDLTTAKPRRQDTACHGRANPVSSAVHVGTEVYAGLLLASDTRLSALNIAWPLAAAARPDAPEAQDEIIDFASFNAAA